MNEFTFYLNLIRDYGLPLCLCIYFVVSGTRRELRMEATAKANTKAVQDIAVSATQAITACTTELRRLREDVDALTVDRSK